MIEESLNKQDLGEKPVMLNLGCNKHPLKDYINVDVRPFPGVDVVCDLNERWPWADDSIDFIRAWDIVEHLKDPVHVMNEAWRVLRVGGQFDIMVPSTDGRGAFQDPTHISFWNQNSFLYYSIVNPDHHLLYPDLIKCAYKIMVGQSDMNEIGICYVRALCEKVPWPPPPTEPSSS